MKFLVSCGSFLLSLSKHRVSSRSSNVWVSSLCTHTHNFNYTHIYICIILVSSLRVLFTMGFWKKIGKRHAIVGNFMRISKLNLGALKF